MLKSLKGQPFSLPRENRYFPTSTSLERQHNPLLFTLIHPTMWSVFPCEWGLFSFPREGEITGLNFWNSSQVPFFTIKEGGGDEEKKLLIKMTFTIVSRIQLSDFTLCM